MTWFNKKVIGLIKDELGEKKNDKNFTKGIKLLIAFNIYLTKYWSKQKHLH